MAVNLPDDGGPRSCLPASFCGRPLERSTIKKLLQELLPPGGTRKSTFLGLVDHHVATLQASVVDLS
jgi:hypothetical protein